ncbi:MAG TPA: alpha/beta hydrolase-fold protein [Rhizomicrobium sp.]|nr:alpha/beta hydrolase-fold protein [Rhizomicrobium sp.]
MAMQRLALCALLAICFVQGAAANGRLDRYPDFASRFVAPRNVTIWTPEGYDPKGPPLPVVYMQDGENLYEPSHSLSGADWEIDATVSRLIREKAIPPVIVVGIYSTALRGREYLPRKIADHLPVEVRDTIYAGWEGPPLSDEYLRFIVEELKPFVDAHYNTRRDAAHTFILGSSMGGLISFYAMAEYPDVFGGAACLSMHWLLASPMAAGVKLDPDTYARQVVSAFDVYLDGSRLRPEGHRLYIDRGDRTLDRSYAPFIAPFEAMMERRGWRQDGSYDMKFFPGEEHSEKAWASRVAVPLRYLLADLPS